MFWVFKDPNHVLLKDPVSIMKEIMSWMFKDPIVKVAWFNFDCDHWNRKNWPKKIKFPQMNFFLQKQLITFSCTYYPLSFCKILKKFFQPIQSYVDVPFLGPKWPICLEQFFLGKKLLISFSSTYWPLSLCTISKTFLQQIQSYKDVPFMDLKWPICLNQNFFQKTC